jgi:imidazoleglycerol-phosphate dehydratase/histidinol-phosphatase
LGQALKQALGDKRGIGRYGYALGGMPFPWPSRCRWTRRWRAALDLSGRPYFVFDGVFRARGRRLATELVPHFFRSLCESAGLNLHLCVRGEQRAPSWSKACFKVVARALRLAIKREGRELPSTKGML